jgi:hypothetical protein
MFQWYKGSAVCYAYLYDVSDNIEANLATSRWVTRGWTLQELIAPREIVFFSKHWQALGTRSRLAGHLARVTGIDKAYLAGKSLKEACIAQKMSWVAKRTTLRKEDMAYCLLGIFDVNMPLIYGEGRKAFRRLQEILVREYPKDHSLFAWGTIVERLPGQINDVGQIRAGKPITYEPGLAIRELHGLLAKSPEDFRDCGQVVHAPAATWYFRVSHDRVSVTTLSSDSAYVYLPVVRASTICAFHLERIRIGR